MPLITRDDFIDVYQKLVQRGLGFIISKFNPNEKSRVISAFSDSAFNSANWWIIPKIKKRWNAKITGHPDLDYETYVVRKYLKNRTGLRLLSIGSGVCTHEIQFARSGVFDDVLCMDIAENLLKKAETIAFEEQLPMSFQTSDIYKTNFDAESFDIILFHSSLHHFRNIEELVQHKIKPWLKRDGMLIINEYVGPDRLQFQSHQIKAINRGIRMIPKSLRRRFRSRMYKNRFSGSGKLRMVLADPSECVESSSILPILHHEFKVVEEQPYGGTLLMHILKDIAQNFTDESDAEAMEVLDQLYDLEDQYLEEHQSDFLFGVYGLKD